MFHSAKKKPPHSMPRPHAINKKMKALNTLAMKAKEISIFTDSINNKVHKTRKNLKIETKIEINDLYDEVLTISDLPVDDKSKSDSTPVKKFF